MVYMINATKTKKANIKLYFTETVNFGENSKYTLNVKT